MPKTERAEQRKRGKQAGSKLETILTKIEALLSWAKDRSGNDAENFRCCLQDAQKSVSDAREYYCDYL